MKRFATLILMSCLCFPLLSQIQVNDSVVNIIAYWHAGDKALYEYTEQVILMAGTDTVYNECPYTEVFSLQVTDSTSTGYDIRYTLHENKHAVGSNNNEEVETETHSPRLPKGTTALIRTNECGELINLIEWHIPEISTDTNSTPTAGNPGAPEGFLSRILHVVQLFQYYDYTFYKDSVYHQEEQLPTAWNDDLVDVYAETYVSEDKEEPQLLHILHENKYDSDQLVKSYNDHFSRLIGNPDLLKSVQESYFSIEEDYVVTLHQPSGWNVATYHKIQTTRGDESAALVQKISVIFDDEAYFPKK